MKLISEVFILHRYLEIVSDQSLMLFLEPKQIFSQLEIRLKDLFDHVNAEY
jgi:hypothetical protein